MNVMLILNYFSRVHSHEYVSLNIFTGQALKRGSSGQAIGHYMTPDDLAPDYDSDDGQFDEEHTHNTSR